MVRWNLDKYVVVEMSMKLTIRQGTDRIHYGYRRSAILRSAKIHAQPRMDHRDLQSWLIRL